MDISVEISYFPLTEEYNDVIGDFIVQLNKNKQVIIETTEMSSIIKGEYNMVMEILRNSLKPYMEKYPSVFTCKISNACNTDCKID